MKSDDYVKYLTEQFVKYMAQPSSEKKSAKEQRKLERPSLSYRLFGLLPFSLSYYKKRMAYMSRQVFNHQKNNNHK